MSVKQKFYITLIAVVLLVAVLGFGAVAFLFLKIQEASFQYAESKRELLALEKKNAFIGEFEKDISAIKPELSKFSDALLKEEGILAFVENLERIAERTGNRQSIALLGASDPKAPFPFFTFRVSTWGAFSSFMNFLNYLENQPVYLSVEDVLLAASGGGLVAVDKTPIPLSPDDIAAVITLKAFAQ